MNKHRKDVVDDDNDDDDVDNDNDTNEDYNDDVNDSNDVAVGQEQTPGFLRRKKSLKTRASKKQTKVGDILA